MSTATKGANIVCPECRDVVKIELPSDVVDRAWPPSTPEWSQLQAACGVLCQFEATGRHFGYQILYPMTEAEKKAQQVAHASKKPVHDESAFLGAIRLIIREEICKHVESRHQGQ